MFFLSKKVLIVVSNSVDIGVLNSFVSKGVDIGELFLGEEVIGESGVC